MQHGGSSVGWRFVGALERLGLLSTRGEGSLGIRILRAAHLCKPRFWRTYRKLVPHPLKTLWHLLTGTNRHTLLLPQPVTLEISPTNLIALVSVWGQLPLAQIDPSQNTLFWQVAPGVLLRTYTHDGIDLMVLEEVFVRHDYGQDYKGLRVLDIGGYRGEASLFFLVQGAQAVVCVEPNPHLIADIRQQLEANGFIDRAQIYPVAIGAQTGEAKMSITTDRINSTVARQAPTPEVETISVPVWSFEQLLERVGWDEVDVAKLDCEGCEFGIFAATADTILRQVRVWIMEVHGEANPIVERLRALGFTVQYREKKDLPGLLRAWQPGARLPWSLS